MNKLYFVSKDAAWQKYRMDILNYLAVEADLSVEVLTGVSRKGYIQDSDKVTYKGFKSLFPQRWKTSFYPGILYYIFVNKPDVILAVPNASQLTEFFLIPLARILKIKLIYWTHGYDHGIRPQRGMGKILNKIRVAYMEFMLKCADSLILFSPGGKDYLLRKGVNEKKIYVAPNTLNTDELFALKSRVTGGDVVRVKQDLGLEESTNIILFTGRLVPDKKVLNAIKAFALVNNNKTAVLVIVGDGKEATRLKEYVIQNRIDGVHFLGAIFDEIYLSKLFCASRCFVMPGYVGLAIVHAFCYGLPLITEDIPNHSPEIMFLEEGVNGFKVPANDIVTLAKKISELIENDSLYQSMSSSALETAEVASIKNMVRNMKMAIV